MTTITEAPAPSGDLGLCKVCREPMEAYAAGEHDHCGVFCAVNGHATIEGLSEIEVVQQYAAELATQLSASDDDNPYPALQAGVARLLRWLALGDPCPAARSLEAALVRYLDGEAA